MLSALCDLSNRLPMNRFPSMRQPLPHCKQNKIKIVYTIFKTRNLFFFPSFFLNGHLNFIRTHTYFCRCVWDLLLMAFFSGIHRRRSLQWLLHHCHCRYCCVLFRHCFLDFSACHSLCAPHSIVPMWSLFDLVNQLYDRNRWFDRCWLALRRLIHLKICLTVVVVAVGHS